MHPPGTLILHDLTTARPRPSRGFGMDVWHWLGRGFLALGGWRIAGDWPDDAKAVVTAGPHTSNWDGIWMIAAAAKWRIRLRYMGKKSLTQGPFGALVRWTGCIPIDRSRSNDVVGTMRAAFAAEAGLILVVPPEGTRDRVLKWKSGFYHIAVGAGVPITFAVMDYAKKTVSLPATLWPSGDYAADLAIIQGFYAEATAKYPENFVLTGN
ncbi:1-acyl-sn-glycerol-3-phosphate acyltransferase [Polymorphobacter fuscus]|uniref:Acyltransferase n=1 Tax=Sandarakinorhabdus fusca TaxID=1439888 RepID=A0A7C9KI00_9SPHN|nr:1-acyl-sn-glycerol-3-phosphate acyltransferase [Polymorphobacter fuscus]KAB7647624.1 acyltransferase [Polymorphobacter fuscus]MQT16901.1 acyltransferase [Polymorphobacter fuscus]NJC09110.1 1-acyl-sn-glycerol-3-phosphate acyltransferase [Polymorphobacter fuscus]